VQRLTDEQVELVLSMVRASSAVVAPEEHEDAFDEYAALVRAIKEVPGEEPGVGDKSAAGMFDTGLFLGVGLALLGQIALHILKVAADEAIKEGTKGVGRVLRGRVGRQMGGESASKPIVASRDNEVRASISQELVEKVVTTLPPEQHVPTEALTLIVSLQVDAMVKQVNQNR
jgi:hypothetical protein